MIESESSADITDSLEKIAVAHRRLADAMTVLAVAFCMSHDMDSWPDRGQMVEFFKALQFRGFFEDDPGE